MSEPDLAKTRQWMFRAWALFGASVIILGAVALNQLAFQDEPWDPLGEYPIQRVLNRDQSYLPFAGPIDVTGTKCADEDVTIRGRTEWVSVIPAGTSIEVGRGEAVRDEGCTTFHYKNPTDLIQPRQRQLCQQMNGAPITWRISGEETPRDGARVGVSRTFRTETFRLGCP